MYGYNGSMKVKPGHRDEVIAILMRGGAYLPAAGCHLYVVGIADDDPDTIWVNEVWESKEHHHASLQLPETQAAIAEAMPMLAGEFTSQELTVVGGLGVPVSR
jgi:quinol monooxygenase YgiN